MHNGSCEVSRSSRGSSTWSNDFTTVVPKPSDLRANRAYRIDIDARGGDLPAEGCRTWRKGLLYYAGRAFVPAVGAVTAAGSVVVALALRVRRPSMPGPAVAATAAVFVPVVVLVWSLLFLAQLAVRVSPSCWLVRDERSTRGWWKAVFGTSERRITRRGRSRS